MLFGEPKPAVDGSEDEDVDEPALLQAALAQEAERYRIVYELAPIALITTDPVGKVLEANSTAADYFQIAAKFLVGKPILNYVVPEQRRAVRVWMLGSSRPGVDAPFTARLRRRSGVSFDARLRVTAFADELLWAIVDATAERQAEEALWELNRELDARVAAQAGEVRAVYEQFPSGIAIVDGATRAVRGLNRRARELLGHWPAGAVPGLEGPPHEGDAGPTDPWQIGRALAGERVAGAVTRLLTPEGQLVVLEVSAIPVREDGGSVVAAALTFDDISERRQRDLADAEFVENAAHQLRTPITAISIAAAALEAGAKNEEDERERFIAHIARESDRLARVIDALLGLARLQRGGAGLLVAIVPLAPLLEEIVADTDVRAGVEIVVDCADGVAVVGEGPMLREAIANVVQNAAAHTRHGSIRITAVLEGEHTILEVADTGPGVPAAARERIFERFYQGGRSGARGAGLGLAIAAEAVRGNHGTLELVDSANGATFRFTLPAARLR